MHDFEYRGAAEMPRPYDPANYGLSVWHDEEHAPPKAVKAVEPQTADTMSADAAKQKLCAWAMSQVGYSEGANNSNRYADTPGLSEMYGWAPQNQPWCDVFVDAGFITCFGVDAACAMTYQPMGAGSALCKQSAKYYKEHDAFIPRWSTPEVGDQVFFFASGDINHTGIVVRVVGGSVVTVEGNSSDSVAERCYSTGDSKIAGYGRPNWAAAEGKPIDAPAEEPVAENVADPRHYELSFPYLSKGSAGDSVWVLQTLLQAHNISVGPFGADKDFGSDTELAVRQYQRKNGLQADGVVGPETGAALFCGEVYKLPVTTAEKEEPKADSFWNTLIAKIRK